MIQRFNGQGGPVAPEMPFSSVVIHDGTMYVSGTGGYDPATGTLPDTFLGQAEQVLKNLTTAIESAGGDMNNVLKCTCFVTNMSYYKAFNELFHEYLPCQPARSCIEVVSLPAGMSIEIEAIVAMN
ncbi:MAG: RidA family protein [Solobacterium sp.]|nr:RidA family protein [Solobacterium sp.]MBR2990967.1 RidA family protein [Solobacterium sp.]